MKVKKIKIRVSSPEQSLKIQDELILNHNCCWHKNDLRPANTGHKFLAVDEYRKFWYFTQESDFDESPYTEVYANEILGLFIDAKVGQSIYCLKKGDGYIVGINPNDDYPIECEFIKVDYQEKYTHDGKHLKSDENRSLFYSKPTITGGTTPIKLMVSIGGYEYPEPERVELKIGDTFYYPVLTGNSEGTGDAVWNGSPIQRQFLKDGSVHLSRRNALQHAKARAAAIKDLEGKCQKK